IQITIKVRRARIRIAPRGCAPKSGKTQKVFRYVNLPSPAVQGLLLFLRAIDYLLWAIYKIVLGWWLDPILDRKFRRAFAEDARGAMPFLLDRYGAKTVRDQSPESNDPYQGYVTLGAANLFLRFSKLREENYAIEVSPAYAPCNSRGLFDAVHAVNPTEMPLDRSSEFSWKPWVKCWR